MEPETVYARRVLLDTLQALEAHIDSLILIGAQAVYHHTGASAEVTVPLYTTDADIAVNIETLSRDPEISSRLRNAGFTSTAGPGHWVNEQDIAVDLMVAPHQSGRNKRGARAATIAGHAKGIARITPGLEPSLIDNEMTLIKSFETHDQREFALKVANPAALLVAKAIKISERLETVTKYPKRVEAKDALDVFRIFQAIETKTLVSGFKSHERDEHSRSISRHALDIYSRQAASADGEIAKLASSAVRNDHRIALSLALLVQNLIAAL